MKISPPFHRSTTTLPGDADTVFYRDDDGNIRARARGVKASHWDQIVVKSASPADHATVDLASRYGELRRVLQDAWEQASSGKGHERHDDGREFQDQLICYIGQQLESTDFQVGQVVKKAIESTRLGDEAAIRELLGVINYAAAAVILRRRSLRDKQKG